MIRAGIIALETLADHLDTDGFAIKLGSFIKFKIHHKPSIYRKIPFTGETNLIAPEAEGQILTLGLHSAQWRSVSREVTPNKAKATPKRSFLGSFSACPNLA